MLMIIQAQEPQIAQETVIAIIAASTLVVLALIWLISRFVDRTPTDKGKGPLDYGNFFVVILGIMTALIGFLVSFPLVVSNVFPEPTQVIALLSALFGTIVGLVGTYFGVKSSSDATKGAQDIAEKSTPGSNVPPGGLISRVPPETSNGAATDEAIQESAVTGARRDTEETGPQGERKRPEAPSREEGEGKR